MTMTQQLNIMELLYGKAYAERADEFMSGLKEIGVKYSELFEETDFSKHYIVTFQPTTFTFLKKLESTLPATLKEETYNLFEQVFNTKNKSIN
jgi:hypothetical protein